MVYEYLSSTVLKGVSFVLAAPNPANGWDLEHESGVLCKKYPCQVIALHFISAIFVKNKRDL